MGGMGADGGVERERTIENAAGDLETICHLADRRCFHGRVDCGSGKRCYRRRSWQERRGFQLHHRMKIGLIGPSAGASIVFFKATSESGQSTAVVMAGRDLQSSDHEPDVLPAIDNCGRRQDRHAFILHGVTESPDCPHAYPAGEMTCSIGRIPEHGRVMRERRDRGIEGHRGIRDLRA